MADLSEYQSFCSKLFKETQGKFSKEQRRYDKETNHYLNEKEQDQWEEHIASQFLQLQKEEKKFYGGKVEEVRKVGEVKKVEVEKKKLEM